MYTTPNPQFCQVEPLTRIVAHDRLPPMAEHNTSTGAREVFLRTIAIVGLIAVLVLGAWGIILLAFNLPTIFSNVGNSIRSVFVTDTATTTPSQQTMTVAAPQNVQNGEAFQVSWNHTNRASDTYAYTLSYACESGLSIKAPAPNGTYQEVSCNTPFNSVNATENIRLIPTVTGVASVPAILTVTATKVGTAEPVAFSSATVTVNRGVAVTPTQPTQPTTPSTPSTPTNNNNSATYVPAAARPAQLYGQPDLSVRVTSITPVQSYYGYGQNYNAQQTRRYTMQFTIENVGTNVALSGWNFNTQTPWLPNTYTFTSQSQQTLYPGDRIVYTLGFDAMVENQNCTMQYPSTCPRYDTYPPYTNPNNQNTTCGYRYNGYSNVYACGYTDSNGTWIDVGTNYNQTQYNYTYPNYNQNRTVTINVDPQNWVPELNDYNNRATATLPY